MGLDFINIETAALMIFIYLLSAWYLYYVMKRRPVTEGILIPRRRLLDDRFRFQTKNQVWKTKSDHASASRLFVYV